MFESLSQRLSSTIERLRGRARLTEANIRESLREVRIALLDPGAWRQRNGQPATGDRQELERAYEYFQARQRQFAAVLEAHGIPVTFAHCPAATDARESLEG